MYDDDSFISPVDYDTVTFPVQRVASFAQTQLAVLYDTARHARNSNGELWLLQQRVFEARIALLKKMIDLDYQPVRDPDIRITIRVEQEAVSVETGLAGYIDLEHPYATVCKYTRGGE